MKSFSIDPLRQAFSVLPEQAHNSGNEAIDMRYFYVPSNHAKALHPDNVLVVGIRGSGKSEWWKELQNPDLRELVSELSPRAELGKIDCYVGFGAPNDKRYPTKRVFEDLLGKNISAQIIWRTVIAWSLLDTKYFPPKLSSWQDRITYYQTHFEAIDNQLLDLDNELVTKNRKAVILFDALERTSDSWNYLRQILKGLLQVGLDFRSYRAIRLKIFVRPDMLEDPYVTNFPDSSKLTNNSAKLDWTKIELFNLLWQYLGNASTGGQEFRDECARFFNQHWKQYQKFNIWIIPEEMQKDEKLQRNIFHALAGEWMGPNAKRGFPYIWLPNHLGDAHGKVSPRSFLTALSEAATANLIKDQKHPLQYQAIKKGVQEASKIRVEEFKEDYPWVHLLIGPLKGLSVPCPFESIAEKWEEQNTLITLTDRLRNTDENTVKLPPSRLDQGPSGVKQDLVDLGIFEIKRDGRINLPDVYRVGYGLGRRGGVPPVK
ncbi:hypothetical protein [Methylomonas rivi]|uniref:Uncharacterized protein n=1 Tax=Methylomonas rivi TaxID=2952226 RepID=A0ABT1U082_9GAMM|nr:hypothetical protein [Methylomonas sp. WSC-6]MCQ8127227.1 hypothetical protein [Methylomonas sp. WSC-6]